MASAQRGKGNNPEQVHFVDNANPGQVVITNPDPYFGQPSYPQRPEQPDISPAWVQRPYPGKQYDNPHARGGKWATKQQKSSQKPNCFF